MIFLIVITSRESETKRIRNIWELKSDKPDKISEILLPAMQ